MKANQDRLFVGDELAVLHDKEGYGRFTAGVVTLLIEADGTYGSIDLGVRDCLV